MVIGTSANAAGDITELVAQADAPRDRVRVWAGDVYPSPTSV